jgi:hypothetical protein
MPPRNGRWTAVADALLGGVLGVSGRADALLRARAARLDRGLEVLRARLAAVEEGGGGVSGSVVTPRPRLLVLAGRDIIA